MAIRFHRGLFIHDNALEAKEYCYLKSLAEESNFGEPLVGAGKDLFDAGVKSIPLLSRDKGEELDKFFLKYIKSNGLWKTFRIHHNTKRCVDSFILKYTPGKRFGKPLSPHKDCDPKRVLSIIFTINIDTSNGSIILSNRNDGYLHDKQNVKDSFTFTPKDNSMYCFNGSFVEHQVVGSTRGIRFAFVGFFETQQNEEDVIRLWNPSFGEHVCFKCCINYLEKKYLKRHLERNNCIIHL